MKLISSKYIKSTIICVIRNIKMYYLYLKSNIFDDVFWEILKNMWTRIKRTSSTNNFF